MRPPGEPLGGIPPTTQALLCRVEPETSEARQICENSCKAKWQAAGARFGFIDATSGLPLAAPPPEFGLLRESIHLPRIALIWIAVIGAGLRSWSDGTIIPRWARCLLDGFDPAGWVFLF